MSLGKLIRPDSRRFYYVEATSGAAGLVAAYIVGADAVSCTAACASAFVIARLAVADATRFTLPHIDLAGLFIIGLCWTSWSHVDPLVSIAAAAMRALGFAALFQAMGLLSAIRAGRRGLGRGDIRLAAAAGPWLAANTFAVALFVSAVLGLAFVWIGSIARGRSWRFSAVPFGSILGPMIWTSWFVSNWIV